MNFSELTTIIKDNEFLLAGLGLSGAGLITFWLKDVPLKIFYALKRQFTTDLIIQNFDSVFYEILKFIKDTNKNKNFRTLKLNNGRYGGDDIILSMGYGVHIVFYKKQLLFIHYEKGADSISERVKETIIITKFGRSKNLFEEFIKEIDLKNEDKNKLKLYKMDDGWYYCNKFPKRNLNTIFIEKQKKDLIVNNIKKFIEKESWYVEKGIPYQYGILLHGSPGTGKTSLIKALASELNYNIYYLSPSKLGNIEKAITTCSNNSIVVIEDIDTNKVIHKRNKKKSEESELLSFLQINFSDILNSIDGLSNVHGRILICTTNHLNHLDQALIRPGRFDLLIEVGYVNKDILKQFFESYFNKIPRNINKIKLKNNITVAQLQQMVLLGDNSFDIIKKISVN